ncbi:uncharacterized protein LOC135397727 [Ornithodoros turicata]|uniref:uncharacterized protein LOC135397727 n=1 Tax=Ornithodoros turicata TaxID=34597 RepID=UPI0031393917
MHTLLGHRSLVKARTYGVDSQDENSSAATGDSGSTREESDESSPDAPPVKRPHMNRGTQALYNAQKQLLSDAYSQHLHFAREQAAVQLEQHRAMFETEQQSMQLLLTSMTQTFMQGTQAMMSHGDFG